MAAGPTYEPISTTTLGNSTTWEITLSSIPQTYTDLVLVINGKQQSGTTIKLQYNSDTGSNYSVMRLASNNTSMANENYNNETNQPFALGYANWTYNAILHLMNYSNTTTYKTTLSRSNDVTTKLALLYNGMWRSTAAINSIRIFTDNSSITYFTAGTTFTLYGITAA